MSSNAMRNGGIWIFDEGELPPGWSFDQLGNRCTIRRGASPRPAGDPRYFGGGTIPWIKISDATKTGSRYIESTDEHVNKEGAKCSVEIPAGSLIIANSGVSLGFAAITRTAGCIHDGWLLTTNFRNLDRDYLYYCINVATRRIRQLADGTTQPNLNTDIARHLVLPFPPLAEQKAIAAVLGALDDKIELNRRMNATLEAMGRALFQSWFVDFDPVRAKLDRRQPPGLDPAVVDLFSNEFEDSELGAIPKGWHVGKVSDACSTQYGYTASATDEPIGPHFLRVMDINKQHWIDWSSVPHCVIPEDDKARYTLCVGDIVVARMADPGKSAIVEQKIDAVFASYLVRLKTDSLAHAYYLYYYLKSPAYAEYSAGAMSGSVQANMNARVIVAAELLMPPALILKAFTDTILPLRRQIVENLNQSRSLATIRDTLLPKFISGQVRIKNRIVA
jgi:type I restriction enzyme S subunit